MLVRCGWEEEGGRASVPADGVIALFAKSETISPGSVGGESNRERSSRVDEVGVAARVCEGESLR